MYLFRRSSFFTSLFICILLSACGGSSSPTDPTDPDKPTAPPSDAKISLQLSIENLKGKATLLWQGEAIALEAEQTSHTVTLDRTQWADRSAELTAPAFQECLIQSDEIVDLEQTIEVICSEPKEHSLVVQTENLKGELTIQWDGQTITLAPDAFAKTLKSSNPNIVQPTLVNPINQSCTGDALGLETVVAVWKLVCVDGEPVTHSITVSKPLDYPVTLSLGNQTQVVQYKSTDFDQQALATEEAKITHLGGQQRCHLEREGKVVENRQKWELSCHGFVFFHAPKVDSSSFNSNKSGAIDGQVLWYEEQLSNPLPIAFPKSAAEFVTIGTHHYALGSTVGVREIHFLKALPIDQADMEFPFVDERLSSEANILDYHTTFEAIYVKTETDGIETVYRVNAGGEVTRLNVGSPVVIRPVDDHNDEVALLAHNNSPNATQDDQTLIYHYKKGQLTQTNRLPLPYDNPSVQVGSLSDVYSFVFYHESTQRYIGTVSKNGVKEHAFIGDFPEQVRVITRPFPKSIVPHRWGPLIFHGGDEVDVGVWGILDTNKQVDELSKIKVAPLSEVPAAAGTNHSSIVKAEKLNKKPFSLNYIDHRWYGKFDPEWNRLDGNILVQTRKQPISEGSTAERVEIPMVGDWLLLWEPDRLSHQNDNLERGFVSYTNGNSLPHRDPYLVYGVSYEQFQQFELITAAPFFVAFKNHKGELIMFTQPNYDCELRKCDKRKKALINETD